MPIISQFYGIIIRVYYNDNKQHKVPHLHTYYNEQEAVFNFDGQIIEGNIPIKKRKIVEAWIVIHKEELEKLWEITVNGRGYFKIEPLK